MKGMTVTLLGVVAFGLLFVGSRAEGETTAPSVPDVPNSPGGDSKGPSAGQGGASQTKPEADQKIGQSKGGKPLYECFQCGIDATDKPCTAPKNEWKHRSSCFVCGKTVDKRGQSVTRNCVDVKDSPGIDTCENRDKDVTFCTCLKDLCNLAPTVIASPVGILGLALTALICRFKAIL